MNAFSLLAVILADFFIFVLSQRITMQVGVAWKEKGVGHIARAHQQS